MNDLKMTKFESSLMWDDIVKILTILIVYHILSYMIDDKGDFFGEDILKLMLYTTTGIIVYHLIIKKIVTKYIFNPNIHDQEPAIEPPLKQIELSKREHFDTESEKHKSHKKIHNKKNEKRK